MKKTAEDYLGTTVDEAVITVPADFSTHRGRLQGGRRDRRLKVRRIINEPHGRSTCLRLDKKSSDLKIAVL